MTAWRSTEKRVRGRAGVLLYMVDCAFRVLQQAQPVHITRADASADGSLVTVHFHAGPFTPIHAIQACPALGEAPPGGRAGAVRARKSVSVLFSLHGSTADKHCRRADRWSGLLGVVEGRQTNMESCVRWRAAWLRMVKPWCYWRQDLFIGVVGLSPIQWHPFTTRAGPEGHTLLAHVKGYGSWTQVPAPAVSQHRSMTAMQPGWSATDSAEVQAGLRVSAVTLMRHPAGGSWRIVLRLVHRCVQLPGIELLLGSPAHLSGVASRVLRLCTGAVRVPRASVCPSQGRPEPARRA